MGQIPAIHPQRVVTIKHYKAAMYHPFMESVALTLVDVPFAFVTQAIFTLVLYFLTGLQRSAGQFLYVFAFGLSPVRL